MSKFTDIVKFSGEVAKQVAPGLQNVLSDIGKEADRMIGLGASEAANALFHGQSGFVLYGPNQRPGTAEKALQAPEQQPEMESPEHTQGRSM